MSSLHKLNGDTSWLVRLALPNSTRYYNLLIDPWLDPTPQIDGSVYFSKQTRVEQAAFGSIAEVDDWLRTQPSGNGIDAILFSHPFTDHLHPETIRDPPSRAVLQRVLVLTTADSLAGLKLLDLHLEPAKVVNLSSRSCQQDGCTALPAGITVAHLLAKDWSLSPAWSSLHSGILIAVELTQILYSPHGITPTSLSPHLTTHSQSEAVKRVLLHSFDRQTLPLIGTVACGFPNILDLAPVYKPHLVLATHDEAKKGEGIVGRLLSRKLFPLQHVREQLHQLHPNLSIDVQSPRPGDTIRI